MNKILVTRELRRQSSRNSERSPTSISTPARRRFLPDELRRRVADKDALVCLLTDAIDRIGDRRRAGAEGHRQRRGRLQQHRRRRMRESRGIVVTQHAGRAHRVGGRLHLGADSGDHAASVGRRAPGAPRRMEGLGARPACSAPSCAAKQLGLVGVGRIGRAVAARAGAFGMRVAYTSRREIDVRRRGSDAARSAAR